MDFLYCAGQVKSYVQTHYKIQHKSETLIETTRYRQKRKCHEMMILKKKPRSPLRYAGGKTRGVTEISGLIPEDTQIIYSPFFGGGSVELACANNGILVYGYDNFKPLVEFWQCLLSDPVRLAEIIERYHPLPRTKFYELQKSQGGFDSKYERAAVFYVLNRASFSGTTMSGGMSPNHPRFTTSSIERIRNFQIKNLHVELADFTESILRAGRHLLYLDPPYMLDQRLYGTMGDLHSNFDHEGLAKTLRRRGNWILSYNDSEEIHKLYEGCSFYYPRWKYGMSNDKNSREVLILSNDLAKENGRA